jgi:hypothetical protein
MWQEGNSRCRPGWYKVAILILRFTASEIGPKITLAASVGVTARTLLRHWQLLRMTAAMHGSRAA